MLNLAVRVQVRKKGGLGARPQRTIFKATPFTLAISVTDALCGTRVALEKRRKFGEFYFLSKEFTYRFRYRYKQEFGKNGVKYY